MSDEPTPPPAPPSPGDRPSSKTSSVPLKKETVRITLRAKPEGDGAPIAPPTAPLRPSAPPPPIARPAAPPPAPLGSKTIPLTAPPAAAPRPGAPTVQVAPGAPRPAATVAVGTLAVAPTQAMPKPTVKLAAPPTVAVGGPPTVGVTSAPNRTGVIDDADDSDEGSLNGLAIGTAVLSAITLLLVLLGSDKVKLFVDPTATTATATKMPEKKPQWVKETLPGANDWRSTIQQTLTPVPEATK